MTAIGGATLARRREKAEVPLAAMPLLFGVQQITEGVVWTTLDGPATAQWVATHTYLAFANVLWPILIPLGVLLVEKDSARRTLISVFAAIGVATGLYMLYALFTKTVSARDVDHHIVYLSSRVNPHWVRAGYVCATCLPGVVATEHMLKLLGVGLSASLAIAYLFYRVALPSVWCFLSAILSVVVYAYFSKRYPAVRSGKTLAQ